MSFLNLNSVVFERTMIIEGDLQDRAVLLLWLQASVRGTGCAIVRVCRRWLLGRDAGARRASALASLEREVAEPRPTPAM